MGGSGTAQAMETADVVLMQDDLSHVPMALRIARKSRTFIRQNIALSLGLKLAFLALAIPGITTLWMAVLADVGATLLVTLNGMRLLRESWIVLPAPRPARLLRCKSAHVGPADGGKMARSLRACTRPPLCIETRLTVIPLTDFCSMEAQADGVWIPCPGDGISGGFNGKGQRREAVSHGRLERPNKKTIKGMTSFPEWPGVARESARDE